MINKRFNFVFAFLLLLVMVVLASLSCTAEKAGRPVVLLTDFGSGDYRVSQLKGIILTNNANVQLIDASQDVAAFDIATGAYILDVAAREFPAQAIFVGIVDPYSQGNARYLVATTNKDRVLVLPDNGLLTYIAKSQGIKSIYQISNQKLYEQSLAGLSAERVEGRAAALIAAGTRAEEFGPVLSTARMLDVQDPQIIGSRLLGTVVFVDHYGNCLTNIPGEMTAKLGANKADLVQVKAGDKTISAKFGTIYSDVPKGDAIVLVSPNLNIVQLSINLGNFSKIYGIGAGARIEIDK